MIKYLSIISPRYKIWFLFFFLCIFLNVLLDSFSVILIFPLISILFETNQGLGFSQYLLNFFHDSFILNYFSDKISIKIFFLIFFFLIFLFKNIYLIFYTYFQNKLFGSIEANISLRIFQKNLTENVVLNNEKDTPALIRDASSYASLYVQNYLVSIIHSVVEFSTFVLIILFVGYNYIYETSLVAFFLFLLTIGNYLLIKKKIYKLSTDAEIAQKLKIKTIVDSVSLFKEVKIFNLYEFFFKLFNKQVNRVIIIQNYLGLLRILLRPIIEIFFIFGLVVYLLILLNNNTNITDSLPKLSLFVVAAFRILPSINRLNTLMQKVRQSEPIVKNIYEQLNRYSYVQKKIKILKFKSRLTIKNLYFKYPNKDDFVIKKLNLKLQKGKSYLLFGKSGIGKSTFVEIILGLLKPTKGSIFVDNINIKNKILQWQRSLSYVPQNANLIDETLLNNVTLFSNLNDSSYKINEIIELMGLKTLSNNQNFIGESGKKLSGGQIQRVAIARALFKDSEVLIIDEGTAGLDNKNEIEIIKKIINFKKDIIILFISHKKSLKKYFDYFLEFKNKKIEKIKN
jgi:ABC-type branched-subunit amino acid transport system ATPase component